VNISYLLTCFVYDRHYRADTRPSDYLETKVLMTFIEINNIDQSNGIMMLTVSLDLEWNDELFTVNASSFATMTPSLQHSLTRGLGLTLDPDIVYKPEVKLINGFGSDNNGDISSKGTLLWKMGVTGASLSRMRLLKTGQIFFGCSFDLQDFPFDSQVCTAYYANLLCARCTYALIDVPGGSPGVFIADSFGSNQWNMVGVNATLTHIKLADGQNILAIAWAVQADRFPIFYIATAIIPTVVITIIVISGLWNSDFNSRIALAVTGLLTIVALQFTITSGLPITNVLSWLLSFSIVNLYFVAAVCVECALVIAIGYRPNDEVPGFLIWIIRFHDSFSYSTLKRLMISSTGKSIKRNSFQSDSGSELIDIASTNKEEISEVETAESAATKERDVYAKMYTFSDLSCAVDSLLRLVIPIAYIIYISNAFPSNASIPSIY